MGEAKIDSDPGEAEIEPGEAENNPGEAENDPGEVEIGSGEAKNDPGVAENDPLTMRRRLLDRERVSAMSMPPAPVWHYWQAWSSNSLIQAWLVAPDIFPGGSK